MWLKFGKFLFIFLLSLLFNFPEEKQVSISNGNGYIHNVEAVKEEKNVIKEKPIGSITISKIKLNRSLYDINSNLNNVDKNIEINKSSDMPDKENGNFILASHSGYSSISYFRNLHKLNIGDRVFVNFSNSNYTYEIADIYDVLKTGKVSIKRDKNKKAITMITCLGSTKQLVVIGYLI